MKTLSKLFALTLLATLLASCAYQSRSASQQLSDTDAVNLYNTLVGGATTAADGSVSGGGSGLLNQDPQAILFFVESNSSRPVDSVLAIDDLSLLSSAFQQGEAIYDAGLSAVEVFFVVAPGLDSSGNGQNSYELDIAMTDSSGNNQTLTWTATGGDQFSSAGFSVAMSGSSSIVLTSTDVDSSGNFDSAIKLEVYDSTGSYYDGQISTMAGYF